MPWVVERSIRSALHAACCLLCIGGSTLIAQAPVGDLAPNAIARTVVTLSTSHQADRSTPVVDLVHTILQMPLNHLGMVVREFNVEDGPVSGVDMAHVRAVVTWFRAGERVPDWVWPWLETQVAERGVRVVHLGALEPLVDANSADAGRLAEWLGGFGLGWDGEFDADPTRVVARAGDGEDCAYEGPCWGPFVHSGPWNEDPANRVWLETTLIDGVDRARCPVVTGPWGGIALEPWALRIGGASEDRRWHIDPFEFLREALGLDRVPAPDPSVAHGRRMFFLHVDGDGFESESTVVRGESAAQVFLDRIIDRYRLPMSVSIIVASLTDRIDPPEPTPEMLLAREIFARPNVQIASHAVLHPLNWRRRVTRPALSHAVISYPGLDNYDHDMDAEVVESIRFIDERLAPDGRRCEVMFWSGLANPSESTLAAVRALGRLNLNGGVYRWDALTDSVGYVAPWGKRVGAEFQVYCGIPNENVYEGFFTTNPDSFRHVDTTLENTGRGRILKPANLYVHFYSAERPRRLDALEKLIEKWAFAEQTIPVYASTYAQAVRDAQLGCTITAIEDGWSFRDFGSCRTMRIDRETRAVDWGRSTNVLGARRIGASLFVDLVGTTAELVLAEEPLAGIHVVESDHLLADAERTSASIAFESAGLGPRSVLLGGLPRDRQVMVRIGTVERAENVAANGRLRVRMTEPGTVRVEVLVP